MTIQTLQTIILTIGVLAIIEGLILTLFPKQTKKVLKELSKSKKLRKIALTELIIGLILVFISLYFLLI